MDIKEFIEHLEKRSFPMDWPGHWIDKEWQKFERFGDLRKSLNPSNGETLISFKSSKESMQAAIDCAYQNKKQIAALPMQERLEILGRFRQMLADYQKPIELCLRIEAGKPKAEADLELESALRYLDWVAGHGEEIFDRILAPARLGRTRGEFALMPIGVTAGFLPFSTPITSFVFYFGASVLAGCPMVMCSSSHAVLTTMMCSFIAKELDLPRGMLNNVFGSYGAFKHAISDKRVAAILYTGSREHCDAIRKEKKLGRQVVLQSGGKNAVIVHSSADMQTALRCVTFGALNSAGQRCSSTSRVFVYRGLLDEFRKGLQKTFQKIKVGRTDLDHENPSDHPFMGPLYSAKAVEKYLRFQTMAGRESDETLLWGQAIEGSAGFLVRPSLHYIKEFDNSSAYQSNVLFSPDVAIYEYESLEDAISQINTTDASFSVSFIGNDDIIRDRRHLFLAPNLFVNRPTVELDATLPLAGRLQSGHHRFHGPGIALYLCYPQVLDGGDNSQDVIDQWPWPQI